MSRSRRTRRGLERGFEKFRRENCRRARPRRGEQDSRRPQPATHEPRSQNRAAALQPRLERALREPQSRRGLVECLALEIAQYERRAVSLREGVQFLMKDLLRVAPREIV